MTDPRSRLRAAILARFVTRAPGQKLGRTQLMKLFYFLQELKGVELGYDFRLFTYGPFDSEVLSDLATATGVNTVSEKTVVYPRGYGFAITPGSHASRLSQELETTSPELTAQVDEVVREPRHAGPPIELRSTILFVDRELSQEGSAATDRALLERCSTDQTVLHRGDDPRADQGDERQVLALQLRRLARAGSVK